MSEQNPITHCPNCESQLRRTVEKGLVAGELILLWECRSCSWHKMEELK